MSLSTSVTTHAAFGKVVGHSAKGLFVVRRMDRFFSLPAGDYLEEQVGVPRVVREVAPRSALPVRIS